MTPLIIEAALNGATSKARNPNVPRSPKEITADALACLDAGAAIIHTHSQNHNVCADAAVAEYVAAWAPIFAQRADAILYGTTANGRTPEQRFGHYAALARQGMRMGVIDPGSVNLAVQGEHGLPGPDSVVYKTSFQDIDGLLQLLGKHGLGPSIGVYEPGFLRATLTYAAAGRLPVGAFVKLYFGGAYNFLDGSKGGVNFGLPPTLKALEAYLEMMRDSPLPWAVSVLGGSVADTELVGAAVQRGGHVRVGLEDYGGEARPSNADLVREVAAIATAAGRAVATPEQAANILRLPR